MMVGSMHEAPDIFEANAFLQDPVALSGVSGPTRVASSCAIETGERWTRSPNA